MDLPAIARRQRRGQRRRQGKFCIYTNADCLSNKLNELMSVIDSCDTHPHLIGVCEIKPKNCRFAPSTTEFLLPGYSLFNSNVDTQNGRGASISLSNILTATPVVLCDEFCESSGSLYL